MRNEETLTTLIRGKSMWIFSLIVLFHDLSNNKSSHVRKILMECCYKASHYEILFKSVLCTLSLPYWLGNLQSWGWSVEDSHGEGRGYKI